MIEPSIYHWDFYALLGF
ncbi:hypothetical protein DMP19_13590 [Enterococcus faecium]|nr:hypothetical protein DMP19_13590 [Enterococcus faecium]KAB5609606.1 hypothetical protein EAX59_08975 [Enterococcus faecium]KAB5610010.1 hypothetical protein EAX60_08305 [Enterococcus faecium]